MSNGKKKKSPEYLPETRKFLAQIPEEYSMAAVEQWVDSVLAVNLVDSVVKESSPDQPEEMDRVHLPRLEAEVYWRLVAKYGTDYSVRDKDGNLSDDPSIPILFLWGLTHKYGLGLRLATMVDRDGVFHYQTNYNQY